MDTSQFARFQQEHSATRQLNFMHLYLEGDWIRAYELSAYYCRNFKNDLIETEKLSPTRRPLKELEKGVIRVGFQTTSIEKYLPGIDLKFDEDNHCAIPINPLEFGMLSKEYSDKFLEEWRETVKVIKSTTSKKQTEKPRNTTSLNSNTTKGQLGMLDIIREIMNYPIETKTEKEQLEFLSRLKELTLNLL